MDLATNFCLNFLSPSPPRSGVITPYDWYECSKQYVLVMDMDPMATDLFDLMNKDGPLQESKAKFIFRQVGVHLTS